MGKVYKKHMAYGPRVDSRPIDTDLLWMLLRFAAQVRPSKCLSIFSTNYRPLLGLDGLHSVRRSPLVLNNGVSEVQFKLPGV